MAQYVDRCGEVKHGFFLLQVQYAVAYVLQLFLELFGGCVLQPVACQCTDFVQISQPEGAEGQYPAGVQQADAVGKELGRSIEPLQGRARGQQVQPVGQVAGFGIAGFEPDARLFGQFCQAEVHLRAEVIKVEQRRMPRLMEQTGVESRAAAKLGYAVEVGIGHRVLQQPCHLFGHLLLYACLAAVGGSGTGKSFGYQLFVHRSCR